MKALATARLARKLCTLMVLVAAFSFAVSTDVGTTDAYAACTVSCRDECRQAYAYCQDNPFETYEGCNFFQSCESITSATACESQECCYQYRYWCGYQQSPSSGYCWSLNCL